MLQNTESNALLEKDRKFSDYSTARDAAYFSKNPALLWEQNDALNSQNPASYFQAQGTNIGVKF